MISWNERTEIPKSWYLWQIEEKLRYFKFIGEKIWERNGGAYMRYSDAMGG